MAYARKLKSGRWQGISSHCGRTYTAGTCNRRTDALKAARDQEAALRFGTWADPSLGRLPFGTYARQWLDTKNSKVRERTFINIEGRLRSHLLPAFDSTPLQNLQPRHIRTFVSDLSKGGLAPATVKAIYQILAQIMRTAEIDGLIIKSPCIGIELPRESSREEMRFLSETEVNTLASAIDPRYRAAIYTAAYTGLRAGELWALKVSHLSLLRRRLDAVEALSEVRGVLATGPTKTGKNRTVTLPVSLADRLGKHLGHYPSTGYVFTSRDGGPVRHRNFMRRHFKPSVADTDLDGLRFHDLRHTCVAILIQNGWNPKQIQDRLGHASIRTTLDRYGHLFPGHDTELLERLDDHIKKAGGLS